MALNINAEKILRFLDIIRLRPVVRFFIKINGNKFNTSLIVKGKKMYAETIDRAIALYSWKSSTLEAFEYNFLQDLIQPGFTILDVGANIGFYTMMFADKTGVSGKVIAVEPDESNCKILRKNIAVNNINNVSLCEKAIYSRSGELKLYISDYHMGDHRVYNSKEKRKTVTIKSVTIDDLVEKENRLDLIKFDIQGAEYHALLGMNETFKKFRNLKIISEFSPFLLKESGSDPQKFLDIFLFQGFSLKYFDEKRKVLKKTNKEELLDHICTGKTYVSLFLERE